MKRMVARNRLHGNPAMNASGAMTIASPQPEGRKQLLK